MSFRNLFSLDKNALMFIQNNKNAVNSFQSCQSHYKCKKIKVAKTTRHSAVLRNTILLSMMHPGCDSKDSLTFVLICLLYSS